MVDTRKYVQQVDRGFDTARKALFEIKVALGKGDHAKGLDTLLTEVQKLEAKFDKLAKSLPSEPSKHVQEVDNGFDAIRKGLFEIKVATAKGAAAKDIDQVLNEAQKLEANFDKLAKSLR